MKKRLEDIADIYFGPQEKGSVKGSIKYLLASHFDKYFQPTKFQDSFVKEKKELQRYILQPNDVIVAGKGHRLFAWAYNPDFGPAIPSSLFYIVKIKNPDILLGEYLANFLNTEKMNHKLTTLGAGTSIPSVQKSELAGLNVPIPPIAVQQRIVELSRLMDEDVELASVLLEKKKKMKMSVLNSVINQTIMTDKTG
jgi:restriction endonuclease S subunit